jgi:four helix bundle protein
MSVNYVKTYRDLIVWQKAFNLAVEIYRVSSEFPRHELYGLSAELRKTSRSIVCNIAEGHKRGGTAEYIRFLRISAGSAAELETQVMLADRLGYFSKDAAHRIVDLLSEIVRILDALIRTLTAKIHPKG